MCQLPQDRHGQVVREVAPACFALPLPDQAGQFLPLRVALVRDLRRHVPSQELEEETAWDRHKPAWWQEDWKAEPTPALPTTAKLVPMVTTADTIDAVELAQTYIRRWPVQENVIKDFLLPLGLDTNHGYAKTSVENSEVAKRRTALENRLANVKRWADGAGERSRRAGKRHHRLEARIRTRANDLYRRLNHRQDELVAQGVADHLLRCEIKERKAAVDAEIEQMQTKMWRAYEQCNQEFRKQERYCKEQCDEARVHWKTSGRTKGQCMNWTTARIRS